MRVRPGFAFIVVPLLVAGCAGGAAPRTPSPSPSKTFSYPRMAPDPAKRCARYPADSRKVVVPSTDGLELAGAETGSGPRGLVLLHQSNADLCGWAPYVAPFVAAGLHVLAVDMRCDGLSDCDSDAGGDSLVLSVDRAADAAAAVAFLRSAGATTVAVMGASMGAATAVVAGGRFPDQVDAVVALSLFRTTWNASGPTATDVHTAADAVPRTRAPILIAGGGQDLEGSLPADAARTLLAGAPSAARCVVVDRPDSAAHGWDLLDPGVEPHVGPEVLAFLAANLRG